MIDPKTRNEFVTCTLVDPKTLTVPDWGHVYKLVESLLHTIRYDDTGVTDDLIEEALIVAEILNIIPMEPE